MRNSQTKYHRIYFILSLAVSLIFLAACPETNHFYPFEVKVADDKIVFSQPRIEAAMRDGNFCVLRSISVGKKAENFSETVWQIDTPHDAKPSPQSALQKPFIVYGEDLPGMSVWREPKPLRDGRYTVSGSVVVYNPKNEFLSDMQLTREFSVKIDEAGRQTIYYDEQSTK